jgi:hypothetical protein
MTCEESNVSWKVSECAKKVPAIADCSLISTVVSSRVEQGGRNVDVCSICGMMEMSVSPQPLTPPGRQGCDHPVRSRASLGCRRRHLNVGAVPAGVVVPMAAVKALHSLGTRRACSSKSKC